ncbi:ComF family protein [Bacillus sp. NPDC077027]|uniref:ComF family protein n=1 Tax=Bacillus sp. NPDC077027 TaxID=3390548 RepID=UPI003D055E81
MYMPSFTWKSLLLSEQDCICIGCKSQLKKINGHICPKCGREQANEKLCADCIKWKERWNSSEVLTQNRSVYLYNDFMKETLSRFKFRGDVALAEVFKRDFREVFKRYYQSRHHVFVPIPLSKERLKDRGFNQSTILASLLKGRIIHPLAKANQEKQSKKRKSERLHQTGMFTLLNQDIAGQDVILIDDIYTTGATIYEAARLLKNRSGAKSVSSFTLIRS